MADLSKATRELFIRSLVDEVFMATPVIESLQRRRQVTYKGGTSLKRLVTTDDMSDLVQTYTANEALRDEKKDMLEKPEFYFNKLAQLPLRYDVDEYLQNITAGNEEQLLDLAEFLVQKGHDATRLYLERIIFNSGSTTAVSETGKTWQSLVSALRHDATYGTLTRTLSTTTKAWWQGADPAGLVSGITTTSQTTATNLTRQNLRKWIYETDIAHHATEPLDLEIYMCPSLFNKLKAEMESHLEYAAPANGVANQRLTEMVFDGHRIISVPYLQTTSTMKTWLFILNMKWFEFRVHSKRNFEVTDFKWQGENANGYDYWLARILWAGNFICWKPNASMFLTNVS